MSNMSENDTKRIREIESYFDAEFYLRTYPDVSVAGVDPLNHYYVQGWHELRDPAPDFSTKAYLENNPDVSAAKVNPFWHYVVVGKKEGRQAYHPGGYKANQLQNLKPFTGSEHIANWPDPENQFDPIDLFDQITATDSKSVLISVSHDNYLEIYGGVQLCLHREQELAQKAEIAYVNIHPYRHQSCIVDGKPVERVMLGVSLNGRYLGQCTMIDLIIASARLTKTGIDCSVAIHSFIGHDTEGLILLLKSIKKPKCIFWIHDFFTLCQSYTLQRNDITYCAAPSPNSGSCSICKYGAVRKRHLSKLHDFFNAVDVHVIAPSSFALSMWREKSQLRSASETIEPHLKKSEFPQPHSRDPSANSNVIKVAFAGSPTRLKGWRVFEALAKRHKSNEKYEFHYFGMVKAPSGIIWHPVHVKANEYTAMSDAIRSAEIDIIIHWSETPETFSFSTWEAIVGGAFVITNPWSGNVKVIVESTGHGVVVDSETALNDMFDSLSFNEVATSARKARNAVKIETSHSDQSLTHLQLLAKQ